MLNSPLVSVVMPAYNAGKYIEESISSVIHQTYPNWELLIVDDGSTDNTAAIVLAKKVSDTRIKYFQQQRGRQGKARNLAIRESRGELIAFLDADDTWSPLKLETQIRVLNDQPEIDLVFCPGYIVHESGPDEFFYVTVQEWSWKKDRELFIFHNQIPILSAIVKRDALFAAGLFIEDAQIQNIEDYHLWIKLLHNGSRFLSIPDYLFQYRVHDSQSSNNTAENAFNLLNCYLDLTLSGIIDRNSKALKKRMKWMIFQPIPSVIFYQKLKYIYPSKSMLISVLVGLNKWFPDNVNVKKIAFRLL